MNRDIIFDEDPSRTGAVRRLESLTQELHRDLSQFFYGIGNRRYPVYHGRGFDIANKGESSFVREWKILRPNGGITFEYKDYRSTSERISKGIFLPALNISIEDEFVDDIRDYYSYGQMKPDNPLFELHNLPSFHKEWASKSTQNRVEEIVKSYLNSRRTVQIIPQRQ